MKIHFFALAFTCFASSVLANLSLEDEIAKCGGLVVKPPTGKIALCDYQKKLAKDDWLELFVCTSECPIQLSYEHRAMSGGFNVADAGKLLDDANAAIFIVDDPALPMTMVAMEAKWGLVNVSQIAKDGAKPNKIKQRAEKLLTRVFTVLFGGGNSVQVRFSAMMPIYTVADIDKMWGHAIAPMSLTQIDATLPRLGLAPYSKCTYQQACDEGWAPQPTNDVQKALWDEMTNKKADKADPTNRWKRDFPDMEKPKAK